MASLSSLAPITTLATSLSNLILVSPSATNGYQPQNPPDASGNVSTANQPPSLLFHYEGEQTVTLQSDITDHYIEDNTAVQDQIAIKPVKITTHGFIGELNNIPPAALALLQTAALKLTAVQAYTPALTIAAQQAYAQSFLLYQTASNAQNAAVSAWSSLSGGESGGTSVISGSTFTHSVGNQNKQQVAFQQFFGYMNRRTLFTVQTPWAIFQNMAIESLRAIQDAETRVITDFELTFKGLRFASTAYTSGAAPVSGGRSASQRASLTNLGKSSPVPSVGVGQAISSSGVG